MGTGQPSANLTVKDKYVSHGSMFPCYFNFFFNFNNGNTMYAQNLECFTAMLCTWDILQANRKSPDHLNEKTAILPAIRN